MKRLNASFFLAIPSVFLTAILAFSLFGNIAYPLLWNDEGETALYAKQILKYGVPKIHDGKNLIYLAWDGQTVCYKKRFDAFIGLAWGQYYFCAPGAWFAKRFDDIYAKTAVLRIPFACAGFLGILLAGCLSLPLFETRVRKGFFFISFMVFEIISVYLALHIREVRYYSLALLFSTVIVFIYSRNRMFQPMARALYWALFIAFSMALFNSFYPALIAVWVAILLYECRKLGVALTSDIQARTGRLKNEAMATLWACLPMVVSFVLILLGVRFYNLIGNIKFFSSGSLFTFRKYLNGLNGVLDYFIVNEFLVAALILKALGILGRVLSHGPDRDELKRAGEMSGLLGLTCLATVLLIAKMSLIYERYYIWVQPMYGAMVVLDAYIVFQLARTKFASFQYAGMWAAVAISTLLATTGVSKLKSLSGHFYELTHQYKGQLDYVIPYLRTRYKHPEDLVVATNYDEHSSMYYLECKVIVGYICNNIDQDTLETPDIVWVRNRWKGFLDEKYSIFANYLNRNIRYIQKTFPIADLSYYNIPESKLHGFYTQSVASDDAKAAQIWERFPRCVQ